MLVVETPKDLKQHIGKTLGPSEWIVVDQPMIDKFAEATGDHQWIHVDVERAKKEMPGGKTIAHGYLTLSLLPRLVPQLLKVEKRKRGLNYGSNKIRFTNTVPAGSRIRLKQTIKNVEDVEGNGVRITSEMVMEVEGQERPALVFAIALVLAAVPVGRPPDLVDAERIKGDPRLPFGLPGVNKQKKVANGNYLWISYFWSYLNANGRAGFVMSSQASSAGWTICGSWALPP